MTFELREHRFTLLIRVVSSAVPGYYESLPLRLHPITLLIAICIYSKTFAAFGTSIFVAHPSHRTPSKSFIAHVPLVPLRNSDWHAHGVRGLLCGALISHERDFGSFSQVVFGVAVGEIGCKVSRSCHEGDEGLGSRIRFPVPVFKSQVLNQCSIDSRLSRIGRNVLEWE